MESGTAPLPFPVSVQGYQIQPGATFAGDGKTAVAVLSTKTDHEIALLDITIPTQTKIKMVIWSSSGQSLSASLPLFSKITGKTIFVSPSGLYVIEKDQTSPPRAIQPKTRVSAISDTSLSPDGRYVIFCGIKTE